MASRSGLSAGGGKGKNKLAADPVEAEEAVDSMMGRLNILADEVDVVEMSDDKDVPVAAPVKWSLIGKVLSPAVTHIQSIRAAMKPAWGNPKGLKCRPVVDNIFITDFANKGDMERALEGTPWMVGRHAVLLQELDPRIRPSDVRFDTMLIWVRILNLPFEWMNNTKGLKIAKLLDKNCKLDVDENGDANGCYLRVRADILIAKPLRRWVTTTKNKVECRFELQYEKLPFYCHSCGLIGHRDLECSAPTDRDDRGKLPFDRALRAPEDRRRKLQSFSQAAASASWNSDSRERDGGSRNRTGSDASRTSKVAGDNDGLKPGDQEATSPAAKLHAPQGTKGTQVADIAKNLFASADVANQSPLLNSLPKKRNPHSGSGSEGILQGALSMVGDPPDLSRAMVVCEKNTLSLGDNLGTVSAMGTDKAKKQKNDTSSFRYQKSAKGVSCDGLSGGLALFWTGDVCVRVLNLSRMHIDVLVSGEALGAGEWRFTGFYGDPRRQFRGESWYLMNYLRHQQDEPWLCAGDFNETLSASEQFGGLPKEEWKMAGFREAVEHCSFSDLGYSGLPYTWDNRQEGARNIKARLDRSLGDDKFLERFDGTSVSHIQTTESDHCGILISMRKSNWLDGSGQGKPFKYENMWRRHEHYEEVVKDSWVDGAANFEYVMSSLNQLRSRRICWSREEFGSVKNELKAMRQKLEALRLGSLRSGPTGAEKDLMMRISELPAREEAMARQRSRIQWLKDGDRNTAFVHAKAKDRARNNLISSLKRDDGSFCSNQSEMEHMVASFYKNLFKAQDSTVPELITEFVPRKVTAEMNHHLCAPYLDAEIEQALFMMKRNSSPGPDGFTGGFYIKHWNLQKNDICRAKVKANFRETDVKAICSIPTGRFANDVWSWAKEPNGRFSVRSAYKTLIAESDSSKVGNSMGDLRPFWQLLWKMKIPPKSEVFLVVCYQRVHSL
ncbi:hypothetical protein ACQ4PT_000394 [Festuca glaucescens]